MRINIQLVIVLWAVGHVIGTFVPTLAKIGAAVNTFILVVCFDNGVDHAGCGWRCCQADTAKIAAWQTTLDFAPASSAIVGLMNSTTRSAIDQCPNMAPALVAGCDDFVRVCGIDYELVDPRVFVDIKDAFPIRTAISGAIQAAVATRTPKRTLGRYVDGIAVFGMEPDHGNVSGVLQSHVFPAFAAVN